MHLTWGFQTNDHVFILFYLFSLTMPLKCFWHIRFLKNYASETFACMYLCVLCVWCPQKTEKDVWSPGTKVRTVMSHYAGSGHWTWVFCKNKKCSQSLIHLSIAHSYIFIFFIESFHSLRLHYYFRTNTVMMKVRQCSKPEGKL